MNGSALLLVTSALALIALPALWAQPRPTGLTGSGTVSDSLRGTERPGEPLVTGWRMHRGDDHGWAQPDFDDSGWDTVQRTDNLRPQNGILWLRRPLRVEEPWRALGAALQVELRGSAQIFVDGRLVLNLGSLASADGSQLPFGRRFARIDFPDRDSVVVAIRYFGHPYRGFDWTDATPGFRLSLGRPEQLVARARHAARTIGGHQWLFVGLFAGQALLHALLFWFWRSIRSNFFFSLAAFASALLVGLQFERALNDDPALLELCYRLWGPALFAAMLSLLLFVYELFEHRKGGVFWLLVTAGLALGVTVAVVPRFEAFLDFGLFHLLVLGEAVRVTFLAIKRRWSGAWILGVGIVALSAGLVWQLALVSGLLRPPTPFFPISYYGVTAFFFSGSVYLAFHFARLGSNLRERLTQVELLSRKTLEQELGAKERELERRVLARDNERKTAELDQAREVQGSMLPAEMPELDNVEVAAAMCTATEVAGDFYDFSVSDSGVLTVAIADVTGHGARAGAMVSLVKGMFTTFADARDPRLFLNDSSESIRAMRLPNVHIAMAVARLRGDFLTYTAAGMPPAYVLRAETGEVDELLLEALPLGALPNVRYRNRTTEVSPGDTVLLLSDGLPELLNEAGDALGYRRVERCLKECRDKNPRQIIEHLQRVAQSWSGGPPFPDDLTFVVLRVRRATLPSEPPLDDRHQEQSCRPNETVTSTDVDA